MLVPRWSLGLLACSLILTGCAAQAPKELPKVTIVQSVETISFAPMYVARAKDYFKKEGVDAQVTVAQSGAEAAAALAGKSADFAAIDSNQVPLMAAKGMQVVTIESNVSNMTMNLVVSKKVAGERGLSRSLPLAERYQKLKGLTFGVTGPGAASDVYTRYYLRQAGVDPDKDAKIVTIGGGPALAAALKQGKIDAFQISPPAPETVEADGSGVLIISSSQGDVPELKFPFEVLLVRRDYMAAHPDVVRAVARAVGRANNFILAQPGEAAKLLQTFFGSVQPEILQRSLQNLLPAIPKDGAMTSQGWENLGKVLAAAQHVSAFDATEDTFWTNKYVAGLNGATD